jgi:uncharacterized SAM-binding protein YcdF (DUF218 family)
VSDIVNWAKQALRLGSVGFALVILSIGLLLLVVRPRWGRRWMVAVVLGLWFVSMPIGSNLLIRPLVRSFHSIEDPQEAGSADAIIVLGGGILEVKAGADSLAYPYEATSLRILETARVFRLLDGRPLVIASGGISGLDERTTEAEIIAEALVKLHIPRDRIVIENESQTTREQAIIVSRLLKSRGIARSVLVTSPTHMWRSVAVFRAQHADVVPSIAPLVPEHSQPPPFFMPNPESLQVSDDAIHDYGGVAYYWARGWLGPAPVSGRK